MKYWEIYIVENNRTWRLGRTWNTREADRWVEEEIFHRPKAYVYKNLVDDDGN